LQPQDEEDEAEEEDEEEEEVERRRRVESKSRQSCAFSSLLPLGNWRRSLKRAALFQIEIWLRANSLQPNPKVCCCSAGLLHALPAASQAANRPPLANSLAAR